MKKPAAWATMASLSTLAVIALAAGTVCLTSGCASVGYLWQSTTGHLGVVRAAKPVDTWLADPATPAPLRDRLRLSQRLRDWAVSELHLPDNGSYRRYADLQRKAVVWNVVAAPALSLQLKTQCFPVVGCVGYQGFYDEAAARARGEQLKAQGLDVTVYGVPAYSTLGWFDDPLLNTFITYPEGELARMIFHELSHQVLYAKDDTAFNESFATAVERIGSARWLATQASAQARDDYARFDARRQDFRALTTRTRDALDAAYTAASTDEVKLRAKENILAEMRQAHAQLKAERWGGDTGYDGWMARANNASLGMVGAYNDLVPDFERLFEAQGRDFPRFYEAVKTLAALPKEERLQRLKGPSAPSRER